MAFVGPWALNYLVKPSAYTGTKPVTFKWGVALNPYGPASRAALVSTGIEVMSAHTKNPRGRLRGDQVRDHRNGNQAAGAVRHRHPRQRGGLQDPAYTNEYKPYDRSGCRVSARAAPPRLVPQYDKFNDAVTTAFKTYWTGQTSLQQRDHRGLQQREVAVAVARHSVGRADARPVRCPRPTESLHTRVQSAADVAQSSV